MYYIVFNVWVDKTGTKRLIKLGCVITMYDFRCFIKYICLNTNENQTILNILKFDKIYIILVEIYYKAANIFTNNYSIT